METLPEYVKNSQEVANFLDVAEGTIASMVDSGIVVEARNERGSAMRGRFDLLASVVSYIRFLRTRKAEKDPETIEFERNRNLKMQAQAEEATLKLAVLKGELHTTNAVLGIIGPQNVAFKQKMLAIPSKVSRVLAAETDLVRVQKILTGEIKEALNELRGFKAKRVRANGHSPGIKQKGVRNHPKAKQKR